MKQVKFITVFASLIAFCLGFALAHSNVVFSIPKDHAHVRVMPRTISLRFDEAIETKLSVFKVYFMPESMMMQNGKMMSSAKMDDVAEKFATKMLNAKDTPDRVDAGLAAGTAAQSKQVALLLKPNTKRVGVYVVMWRTTSVDTHVETGFVHFHFTKK